MKSLIYGAIAASVLAAPMVSFAQQANAPVTRAQVRAELEELVRAGFNPSDRIHYPDNLWAAQRRVQEQHALAQNAPTSAPVTAAQSESASYGPSTSGSSQSAPSAAPEGLRSIYFHH